MPAASMKREREEGHWGRGARGEEGRGGALGPEGRGAGEEKGGVLRAAPGPVYQVGFSCACMYFSVRF